MIFGYGDCFKNFLEGVVLGPKCEADLADGPVDRNRSEKQRQVGK